MGKRRVQLGKAGERLIDAALRKHHYTIIDRNWRCTSGEVDLVAERNGEWYFVEVRTRRGPQSISPEQGLSYTKRQRMEKVARTYIGRHAEDADIAWHLSFAAVVVDRSGRVERATLYSDIEAEPVELL